MKNKHTFVCPICGQTKGMSSGRPAEYVSGPVGELIRKKHEDFGPGHMICFNCLKDFRAEYLRQVLKEQRGEVSAVEQAVLDSFAEQDVLARNINPEFDKQLTFGERLSDRVAGFGGSWRFIIIAMAALVLWVGLNSYVLLQKPFDPYPFILLNLVLSCVAALQAPIIMMSQNRQEDKDRLRAEHDYQVNLKAEIEIRQLHLKLDQLINNSWQRLLEIQEVQIDLMEELAAKRKQ